METTATHATMVSVLCLHADLSRSYVLLAATSTFFVNTLHAILTVKARKAAGQKYPIAYASNEVAEKDRKAYLFNCGMCSSQSNVTLSKLFRHANNLIEVSPGGCLKPSSERFTVIGACLPTTTQANHTE